MAHSWEIKQANSKNINIPSGFKSYEIGPITVFKLVNSDKGSYKSIDEISDAIINKIVVTEIKRLKSELQTINKIYNKGSVKGIDIRYIKNIISSLIKRIEKNDFEELRISIQKMFQKNNTGGKLNNYELLFDSTINGFKQFWSVDYPTIEKHLNILYNFKKTTLNKLNKFEMFIKENKKNIKNINVEDFNNLNDILSSYEIELNANSIIKKNHYFKKLISNENLIDDNFSNYKKFDSWLNLETVIYKAIKETELEKEREANFKITNYFETNEERAERERKDKKQYKEFQKNLNICKTKLRKEFKNLYPEKFNAWSKEINELEKLNQTNLRSTNGSLKLATISDELSVVCEIQDKTNREILKFIKSVREKVLIINGMAGTGKTSKVAEIINLCDELNLPLNEVFISAPSTVGAANIRQRWRLRAEVFQKRVNKYTLYQSESLRLFIVDEANMLTSAQLKMLFKKYKKNKEIKFIFIGDSGQINAYDHDNDKAEESPALDKESIVESAKKAGLELTKYEIRDIELTVDFRFLNIDNVDRFLAAMKWLREEDAVTPIFENFLEKAGYPYSEVVETLKSKNEIIDKFNANLSIYDYLNKRIEVGQAIDIERLKKRFSLKFDSEKTRLAIKEYENPENRRPELGKLYSKLFPNIKQRTRKPEEVDSSIILRRSNEGVVDSNTSLRPHLFNESDSELKEIELGELIFIKKTPKNTKEYQLKTNIDDGDLVVVTKLYESIEHNGNKISHIGVKPVLKRLDTFSQNLIDKFDRFAKKFLNLGISLFSEIDITVWHGNLNIEDDYEKWKEYIDLAIRLKPEDKKFHDPYLITYGYTRTMFTAQGGEWENVFIHQGDMWGYSAKEQKKYVYTAVSRTSKKVYFSN